MLSLGGGAFQGALVCLLGIPLWAADVTLHGRIVDEANAPVPGAIVSLRLANPPQSSQGIEVTADPTGAFQTILPEPGSYFITIAQTDFFPLTNRPLDIRAGPNEIILTLNHVRNTSESVDVKSAPSPSTSTRLIPSAACPERKSSTFPILPPMICVMPCL